MSLGRGRPGVGGRILYSSTTGLTIILASSSPRRAELLAGSGVRVRVRPVGMVETVQPGEAPEGLVQRLAEAKAERALADAGEADLVLGADTVVVQDDVILGKPATPAEAEAMLLGLAGRSHRVLTGLSLIEAATGRRVACITESHVRMLPASDAEIRAYVATGSPMDKAGAYGIQDERHNPVDLDGFSDCFTNVMGLPLCRLGQAMEALGHHPPVDLAQACQSYGHHTITPWLGVIQGAA